MTPRAETVTSARAWVKDNASLLKDRWLRPTSRRASDYGLPDDAVKALVPFMSVPDGGSVALWFQPKRCDIVFLGSEGDNLWLAPSLRKLLVNVANQSSGLPDVDDGERYTSPSAKHTARFVAFIESTKPKEPEGLAAAAEPLRVLLVAAAKKHQGRTSVYWQEEFMVTGKAGARVVDWYDGGRKRYRASKAVLDAMERVLEVAPKKKGERSFCVDKDGTLYIDREFPLRAPAKKR